MKGESKKNPWIRMLTALTLITAISLAAAMSSCVGGNGDDPNGNGRTFALVTYTGPETVTLDDGSTNTVSGFTFYDDDNTVSTCRSTVESRLPENAAKPGQRMVIGYTFTGSNYAPYPAGTINLMSYVLVTTAVVETVSHETAVANDAEIELYYSGQQPAINRTGNYINLEAIMQYYPEREFSILADETTLDTSMPDLYISTTEKGIPQGVKSRTMASFDISTIWRNPSISGVKIHIKNTGGNLQQEFIFRK